MNLLLERVNSWLGQLSKGNGWANFDLTESTGAWFLLQVRHCLGRLRYKISERSIEIKRVYNILNVLAH